MRLSHSFTLSAVLLSRHSFATLHHLFVSSYSSPDLWTLELDDVRRTLTPIQTLQSHDGHPVLAFSYDRSIVYAGEVGGYASYHLGGDAGPYALTYNSSIGLGGDCLAKANKNGYGSTAIAAEAKGPYIVYGAPLAGCGQATAVNTDLDVDFISQNFTYNRPTSAIRGLALDTDNKILYSADLGASGVWAHSINDITGAVTSIGFLPSHIANAGPRKIVAHPSGKYVYVLQERTNLIAVYAVNKPADGSIPKQGPITFTGLTYALLPPTESSANYWASDMSISEDGSRLIATTRYRIPSQVNSVDTVPVPAPAPVQPAPRPQQPYNPYQQQQQPRPQQQQQPRPQQGRPQYPQQQNPYLNQGNRGGRGRGSGNGAQQEDDDNKTKRRVGAGYVTAILLTPNTEAENADSGANVGWGYPIRRLFQTQTSTSGGMSNSVSAAPWGDAFFAITDSEFGVVEVWKIDGLDIIDYGGNLGQDAASKGVGGWSLGTWSPQGSLVYSEAGENPSLSAVAVPGAPSGWAEGRPRAQVPESYYNPPPKASAKPPVAYVPPPAAATPTSTLPWWLGGSSDPNSGGFETENGGNSLVQVQPAAPGPAAPVPAAVPSPAASAASGSWFGGLFGGSSAASATPSATPSPSSTSGSWFGGLFGRTGEAESQPQLEARQVPATPVGAAAPLITARVFAYWRAPQVKAKFPQGGCCSNPLWYD